MKPQVLIIDDDEKICNLLSKLFNNNGYVVFYALNTIDARKLIKYISFNALVVDYMMPKENGIEFIDSLRSNNINTPAIMLTAVDEVDNKILAFNKGTNDYLSKPFNSQELLLRIKNILKIRYNIEDASTNILICGDLNFNKINNSLRINNEIINLSTLENDIFKIFINNINKIIYKEDILRELGKQPTESNLSTLNVNIMRLRKKLEYNNKKYIKTIRGKGFILSAQ